MSQGAKVNYFVIKGRFRELKIDSAVKYSATLVAKYIVASIERDASPS